MKTKKQISSGAVARQVGAVALRAGSAGREILLITSRETKRWVVPKGNRIKGLSRSESAAAEAFEEAGLLGKAASKPFDHFLYWKRRNDRLTLCQVDLFLVTVTGCANEWKEKGQRERAWFPLDRAAELVEEPGLQTVLRNLAIEAEALEAGA